HTNLILFDLNASNTDDMPTPRPPPADNYVDNRFSEFRRKHKDDRPMTPFLAFERLFFAVFGQTTTLDINPMRHLRPEWTEVLFKFVFGIYLLVSVVVLINLLIAMMSDTYQRIQ
ncbi:Hypothetical predicted protein, partial [Drosophila guanche]